MDSKDKGNIGEAIFLFKALKLGCIVSKPFGDNARYDYIIDWQNKLYKVQVKYCSGLANESFICPCSSSKNHTTNKRRTTYNEDVDYLAFYLSSINEIVMIPIEEIGEKKTICFRKTPPKNNQKSKIHYVDDYLLEKNFLCRDFTRWT